MGSLIDASQGRSQEAQGTLLKNFKGWYAPDDGHQKYDF
jgi:hypothetical protein